MYAGRVVERAPTATLFKRTRMPYTRALMESIPRVSTPSHARLHAIAGAPPDPVTLPAGCRLHPRCPPRQPHCTSATPPLESEEPGHLFACLHPLGNHRSRGAPT